MHGLMMALDALGWRLRDGTDNWIDDEDRSEARAMVDRFTKRSEE